METLSTIEVEDYCERVGHVRGWAGLTRAGLSALIGEKPGYISWVEGSQRPIKNQMKTVDAAVAKRIANSVAGKRYLTRDAQQVFLYLMGEPIEVTNLLSGLMNHVTGSAKPGEDPLAAYDGAVAEAYEGMKRSVHKLPDAKKGTPEGAPRTTSSSSTGSQDQMS